MSSTHSKPVVAIINSLGYDVDIYDVYNHKAGTQGPLTYTKLATIPNGTAAQQVQTIHYGSQLQAMRTGNIAALNNNYYIQFPVAVMAILSFDSSNAFTLTSEMQQAMENSFKFIKYAQANPSSKMATSFRTALGSTTNQNDAVNTFFQGTASFQQCTMATWTAVFTWQAQFTNPWQGTYYLYSLGGSSSSSAGSTASPSAPALVATLAIVASAGASSAVLTMAGTNDENTPVVMTGDGTMQEPNLGTGNLSVALTPTWMNIVQTSQQNGKPVVNYVIAAAFMGTINEVQVTGNLNQLTIPPPSDTSQSASDKNAMFTFVVDSVSKLVGTLTSMGMLYYMYKGHKQAEIQKKNDVQKDATSTSDAKKKEAQVEANYQAKDVPEVNIQLAEVQKTAPQVRDAYAQVNSATDIQNKQAAVEGQIGELREVLEDGAPSPPIEKAAINLNKVRKSLRDAVKPDASATERKTALKVANKNLNTTSTEISTVLQNQSSTTSAVEKATLKKTADIIQEVGQQADDIKELEVRQAQEDEENEDEKVNDSEFGNAKSEGESSEGESSEGESSEGEGSDVDDGDRV